MALTAKKVYAILKRQISDMEAKLNSPVRYRGTVATADLLPLNPDIGDMYNIESKSVYGEAGMNVAWNGVVWDTMGAPIDMSLYLTKEEAEAVIQRLVTEYFEKNPVKPGATTEQAQQIEQNKTDLASEISRATAAEETKADKTSLVKTDRKLDALWKLNQGISYKFEEDNTEAYQKTVPSGAKVANVKSIGGKTIVWNQLITNRLTDFTLPDDVTEEGWISNKIVAYNTKTKLIENHKYYGNLKTNCPNVRISNSEQNQNCAGIFSVINESIYGTLFQLYAIGNITSGSYHIEYMLFDLTAMFGSGNEPSTPEEFEAMFPADYYPYNAGELMSTPVNEVIYLDAKTQETSHQIPQAILNLTGYGWSAGDARNEVNFENKQHVQRVGSVDLGTLNWKTGPSSDSNCQKLTSSDLINIIKNPKNGNIAANILCSKYITKTADATYLLETGISVEIDGIVSIYDTQYNSADSTAKFISFISGTMFYYELAEPVITDISDLVGDIFQEPLEVESGGTLTFKNSHGDDYRIPVPSSEEYVISLAEVAK